MSDTKPRENEITLTTLSSDVSAVGGDASVTADDVSSCLEFVRDWICALRGPHRAHLNAAVDGIAGAGALTYRS